MLKSEKTLIEFPDLKKPMSTETIKNSSKENLPLPKERKMLPKNSKSPELNKNEFEIFCIYTVQI